jgi:hypothetical protein
VLSASILIPEPVQMDVLRSLLVDTHQPADAELLAILRHNG